MHVLQGVHLTGMKTYNHLLFEQQAKSLCE